DPRRNPYQITVTGDLPRHYRFETFRVVSSPYQVRPMPSESQPEMQPASSSLSDLLDLLKTKREAGALCRSLGFGAETTFDFLLGLTELAEVLQRQEAGRFRLGVGVVNEGGRFGLELR